MEGAALLQNIPSAASTPSLGISWAKGDAFELNNPQWIFSSVQQSKLRKP